MKIDDEMNANQIIKLAKNIYNHTKTKLCLMGMLVYEDRFRWRMGAGVKDTILSSVMMTRPENDDEYSFFGIKVEFVPDDPWELSLWYDMTEI